MIKRLIAYPLIILLVFLFHQYGGSIWSPIVLKILGKQTVGEVVEDHEDSTYKDLYPLFKKARVTYPPKKLVLIAYKQEKLVELWASNDLSDFQKITQYPIKALSGGLGPKLKEGDKQVPEGLYNIVAFHPASSYHLSMKLNYPNIFDSKHAKAEGRDKPGTNIFIHGNEASIGCLAMGDKVIETLFTLVYKTGKSNTEVIISPTDPSKGKLVPPEGSPAWTRELYNSIELRYYAITKL
jgi:murein L,D-transpeptidase YafK